MLFITTMMLSKFKRIAAINKYNCRYVIIIAIIILISDVLTTIIVAGATKVNPKASMATIPVFGHKQTVTVACTRCQIMATSQDM